MSFPVSQLLAQPVTVVEDPIISANYFTAIITGVILVDKPLEQIDADIRKSVEKFKYHKGFSFGFKGWVDIRVIVTSLNDGSNIANKKGREVSEIYGFTK